VSIIAGVLPGVRDQFGRWWKSYRSISTAKPVSAASGGCARRTTLPRPASAPKGKVYATFSTSVAFGPRDRNGQSVTSAGAGLWNGKAGYTFKMRAADRGEPGRGRDTFTLVVKDGRGTVVLSIGGTIDDGNIQSTPVFEALIRYRSTRRAPSPSIGAIHASLFTPFAAKAATIASRIAGAVASSAQANIDGPAPEIEQPSAPW
jgi:hypothetical protein